LSDLYDGFYTFIKNKNTVSAWADNKKNHFEIFTGTEANIEQDYMF
jgi:hypothetical protein